MRLIRLPFSYDLYYFEKKTLLAVTLGKHTIAYQFSSEKDVSCVINNEKLYRDSEIHEFKRMNYMFFTCDKGSGITISLNIGLLWSRQYLRNGYSCGNDTSIQSIHLWFTSSMWNIVHFECIILSIYFSTLIHAL